jgi:hypothetical protein
MRKPRIFFTSFKCFTFAGIEIILTGSKLIVFLPSSSYQPNPTIHNKNYLRPLVTRWIYQLYLYLDSKVTLKTPKSYFS